MDKLKIQDIVAILKAKKQLANAHKMWAFHWDNASCDESYYIGKACAYEDCVRILEEALDADLAEEEDEE